MGNEQSSLSSRWDKKNNECPSCGAPLNGSSVCQWCGTPIRFQKKQDAMSLNKSPFQYEQKDAADLFEDSIDDFEERITRRLKKLIGY